MDKKPDKKAAISSSITTKDRGEHISQMEPLLIGQTSRHRMPLTDLVVELVQKNAALRHSLPDHLIHSLANLVRAMNCYYSNLIEGHDTHPVEIERALRGDYSHDTRKRQLQLEAKAHIAVQEWIDAGGVHQRATTVEAICEIHQRFYAELPLELCSNEDPITGKKIVITPGAFRPQDVKVGLHIPISAPAVPRFMERFAQVYAGLGKTETILALAAAHHRLVWIHPFLDGNGRVARLMSHACLLDALGSGGIWSIARGLARNVNTYKQHLAACDMTRRNDLDGRSHLSEENLVECSYFFLQTCLDQVNFMRQLLDPDKLRMRVLLWAEEETRQGTLPTQVSAVLEAILYRGELPRAALPSVVGTGERQARRVVSTLIERHILTSESSRAPLQLAFPASLAARWLPGLFPELPT